jgi:ankyrin repeat protein
MTNSDAVELAYRMLEFARAGSAELLDYVDAGVPVDLKDPSGNSLLMLASYHGHAELTAGLGRRGADVNSINDRGQTPLAGAVFKGETEVVQALLELGANPDLGSPSARETAQFFQRDDLATLLP